MLTVLTNCGCDVEDGVVAGGGVVFSSPPPPQPTSTKSAPPMSPGMTNHGLRCMAHSSSAFGIGGKPTTQRVCYLVPVGIPSPGCGRTQNPVTFPGTGELWI